MSAVCAHDTQHPHETQPAHEASNELIESHVPLVGHLLRRKLYQLPAHVNADDLTSAAMTALVLAAQSYDPDRGVPFAKYATLRINGALLDELRGMDWATRRTRTASRELENVRDQLHGALGRTPSTAELAAAMGISVQQVHSIQAEISRARTVPLDATPGDTATPAAPTSSEPETLLLHREQIGYLHDAIAELPKRHRYVITACFFDQRQHNDIADTLGVTFSRVSQIRSEALRMLAAGVQAQGEPDNQVAATMPGRPAKAAAYLRAVAERSTLSARLAMTTATGEITHKPQPAHSLLAT
jgi:RNA polymerase sigma factor for flagellar operon FliA